MEGLGTSARLGHRRDQPYSQILSQPKKTVSDPDHANDEENKQSLNVNNCKLRMEDDWGRASRVAKYNNRRQSKDQSEVVNAGGQEQTITSKRSRHFDCPANNAHMEQARAEAEAKTRSDLQAASSTWN